MDLNTVSYQFFLLFEAYYNFYGIPFRGENSFDFHSTIHGLRRMRTPWFDLGFESYLLIVCICKHVRDREWLWLSVIIRFFKQYLWTRCSTIQFIWISSCIRIRFVLTNRNFVFDFIDHVVVGITTGKIVELKFLAFGKPL